MTGTEFRRFLASDCGTVWTITKFARTFAPITKLLPVLVLSEAYRKQVLSYPNRLRALMP
jgi:hypothetical protein